MPVILGSVIANEVKLVNFDGGNYYESIQRKKPGGYYLKDSKRIERRSKIMTNYRCIKCELLLDWEDFKQYNEICKTCEKNNTDNEISYFRSVFNSYYKEIFCLRYLDEPHGKLGYVSIPGDYWERKKLFETKKKEIEKSIKKYEEQKKKNEEKIEYYKKVDLYEAEREVESRIRDNERINDELKPLKAQQPYVLQLEQKYRQ